MHSYQTLYSFDANIIVKKSIIIFKFEIIIFKLEIIIFISWNHLIMTGLRFEDGYCTCVEGMHFEAKEAARGIPRDMWETYSSFANTDGGTIVLGLREEPVQDGAGRRLRVVGVPDADSKVQNIWNQLNNQEKVSCNLLSSRDVYIEEVYGCRLIIVRVPRAERGDRPVYLDGNPRNSFRRNGEGDFKCRPEEVVMMIADSAPGATDRWVVTSSDLGDLSRESLKAYRNSLRTLKPDHPWNNVDDDEFLRLIGAATMDGDVLRPTFAGLLMFGHEYHITDEAHNYLVDYRAYADDGNDWTDRLVSISGDWTGNLYDFYRMAMVRMGVAIGRGMDIDRRMKRVDDTELYKCVRESVLNALVNADYRGRGGVTVVLRPDSLEVRNPGTFRIPIDVAEAGGTSDPRNQTLAKMFSLIGDSERAGSGVRRMMDTCSKLGLDGPTIVEGYDPETVTVSIGLVPADGSERDPESAILDLLKVDGSMTISSLAGALGRSTSSIQRSIRSLRADGRLEREGGTRGRWVVTGR